MAREKDLLVTVYTRLDTSNHDIFMSSLVRRKWRNVVSGKSRDGDEVKR